jgi:FG-GAP repeat
LRTLPITPFVLLWICSAGLGASAQGSGFSPLPPAAESKISAKLGENASAYQVNAKGGQLHAENPKQTMAADFSARGLDLQVDGARCHISFLRSGYGESGKPIVPQGRSNRAEYRRGDFIEWYVNGPEGLEQGFTLNKPPAGSGRKAVTFALMISGDLTAEQRGKNELALVDSSGAAKIRYRGLAAYDATGKELSASLQLEGNRVLLSVDDRKAQYPVTLDPWIQTAELTSSDGRANDAFGNAVAISGQTIVVGAPAHTVGSNQAQGAAYVFVEPATGWANMVETAELTASDGAANTGFGSSVAISGGTIVIGATGATVGGNPYQGAAYVFVRPAGGWSSMTQAAKLTASDGTVDAAFGESVTISANTVVVGSPYVTINSQMQQGAAYVFVEPSGGWSDMTETAELTSSNGTTGDIFGVSVAINGAAVLVGASGATVNGNASQGAAYIFSEPGGGWTSTTETARLTASDGLAASYFGSSVGLLGNTAVVGAPSDFVGSVYVYVQPSGGWTDMTQTAELSSSNVSSKLLLGSSVSISSNVIVAGAVGSGNGSNPNQGAVYFYQEPVGGWANMTQTAIWTASDGVGGDYFGRSVSTNPIMAVSGAPYHLVGSNSAQGAAYVFQTVNSHPTLTELLPSSATAGAPGFELVVEGTNLAAGAVVNWDGSPLPTKSSYKNNTAVEASVAASDMVKAGNYKVSVTNPKPGGGTSTALTFVVNNPLPKVVSSSPDSALAGGSTFTLTVNGSKFVSTSKVYWNGTQLTTTFVSSSSLTAIVRASYISTAGTAQVTVENPTPGGGTSNAATFNVNNPAPDLTTLVPASILAGKPSFTLIIDGTGFVTTSHVLWNGSNLTTTYFGADKLHASVPASEILTAGTALITVTNPAPGGGTSKALQFTVKP